MKSLNASVRVSHTSYRHRDNNLTISFSNDNFKEMLKFRTNSGDNTLRKHFDAGNSNVMYTPKTTQNDLLAHTKKFIQRKSYEQVSSQPNGQLFGIQIDRVTGSANIERLRSIL